MKVMILGGFLGSGKTTVLMQFAQYLALKSDSSRENKVVILENEVGEVGVDDLYLRGDGLSVANLFAGCACCTVSGELITAVSDIMNELDPEWIIIETTGIAYPGSMRDNLKIALKLDSRVIVIADASRWQRLFLPMNNLLSTQIEGSDAVLINKTDLASEAQIHKLEADILRFEPKANIFRVSALSPISEDVWRAAAGV